MKINFNEVLKNVEERIGGRNTLFTDDREVFYLTRFVSWNMNVLYANNNWYLLTDKRYFEEASRTVDWMKVVDYTESNWIEKIQSDIEFNEVHINDQLLLPKMYAMKKSMFVDKGINVIATDYGFIRDLYTEDDIQLMRKALEINEAIYDAIVCQVKPGMSEKDVEKLIIKEAANTDAEGFAFETNVASGTNTSSPVIFPSDRIIGENELITIDMGIKYKGFCSDMTRTFVVAGKVDEEVEKLWNAAHKAAMTTIEMVKEGAIPDEMYKNAMKVVTDSGYPTSAFPHGAGHCLGVELHNQPGIGQGNTVPLKAGQVLNIEPGIYIPGKFGVRIEQTVLVTKDGYEMLSKSPVYLYKNN